MMAAGQVLSRVAHLRQRMFSFYCRNSPKADDDNDANGMDLPRSRPNGSQSARGLVSRRSTTMPRTTTLHAVTAIGIDMGKTTLHMIGLDARGAIVLRERVSRGRIASRLAKCPSSSASKREWRHTMSLVS